MRAKKNRYQWRTVRGHTYDYDLASCCDVWVAFLEQPRQFGGTLDTELCDGYRQEVIEKDLRYFDEAK